MRMVLLVNISMDVVIDLIDFSAISLGMKVTCKQIIDGLCSDINKSNSCLFALNPRQFHCSSTAMMDLRFR